MKTFDDIERTRGEVLTMRRDGDTVGFVATMGALHAGHRSLIEAARSQCDRVVISIFVNPTQFSPDEDCDRYPRNIEADLAVCRQMGVDLVFTPSAERMFAAEAATTVHVDRLTKGLCGLHRPGHFDGVTTIVTKLFNIIPADMAFFGEKDYQQLKTVQRMVVDLNIPIQIVACPTVRDPDGLAASSRNAYLTPEQRQCALSLPRGLQSSSDAFGAGQRDPRQLAELAGNEMRGMESIEIDYINVVDAETLEPVATVDGKARICAAVRIGDHRLIDNLPLNSSN